jgi:hypothetical protein
MVAAVTEHHAVAHDFPVVLPGRHLAQNVFLAGLHARRHGDRSPHDGLHALPGEGDGLLGPGGDPGLVQHHDLGFRVVLLDEFRDVRVVGAAAAHEDLLDLHVRRSVALVVVDDGLRRHPRDAGHDVVRSQSLGFRLLDEFEGQRVAEHFPSRRLGRVQVEVLVLEELVHELLVHFATSAHLAVPVVLLLTVGVVSHDRVDEDVSGAGVEVVALVDPALVVRRDKAHIGNAANVLASAELGRVVQDQSVKEGDQGSALPTRGLVADPEVGDGSDARARGQERSLRHGQSAADLAGLGHRQQPDGLSVRAEGVDAVNVDVVVFAELLHRRSKRLAQNDIDFRQFGWRGLVVQDDVHHTLLDGLLQRDFGVLEANERSEKSCKNLAIDIVYHTFRSSNFIGESGVSWRKRQSAQSIPS